MSKKIGIVSEGVSDYYVLKHIVSRYLKEQDFYTIPLNPKQDKGKQIGFSGWQGVLNYISGTDDKNLFVEALKENCEYVVVQIDTDVCAEYEVEHQTENLSLLWQNVRENLVRRIPADFDKSKLIFAISIDETECWLIPFIDTNRNNCENTNRCVNIVNKDIKRQGLFIDPDNKNSDGARAAYDYILKQKKKPKEIKDCSEYNYGFKKLIEQLDAIVAKEGMVTGENMGTV